MLVAVCTGRLSNQSTNWACSAESCEAERKLHETWLMRGGNDQKNVGMYLGCGERHQIPILLHRTLGLSKATIVPGRKSPHFAAKRTGKQQRLSTPEPEKYGKTGPRSTAQFKHPPARNSMKFREWHHSHRLHMERCRITSTALKELHGFIELLLSSKFRIDSVLDSLGAMNPDEF